MYIKHIELWLAYGTWHLLIPLKKEKGEEKMARPRRPKAFLNCLVS